MKDYLVPLAHSNKRLFNNLLYSFFDNFARSFPWRRANMTPYQIVISEIMLQQTQADRVIPKYSVFIRMYPNFKSLANAQLRDVLKAWQGLGYNRRAQYLHKLARIVHTTYNGAIPRSVEALQSLPGIGRATAASICAFAFNMPVIFIETNVRTVFIHHLFHEKDVIHDCEVLEYVNKYLDITNPRKWYSALMDYGTFLKRNVPNPSRKSKHHIIQSPFHGSDRKIRGTIIRNLTHKRRLTINTLAESLREDEKRIDNIVHKMIKEKLIIKRNKHILIAS